MSIEKDLRDDENYREYKVASYQISDYQMHAFIMPLTGLLSGLSVLLNLSSFPPALSPVLYWIGIGVIVLSIMLLIKSLFSYIKDFIV